MRATEAMWLSNPDTKLTAEDRGNITHLSLDRVVGPGVMTNRDHVNRARTENRRSRESLFG